MNKGAWWVTIHGVAKELDMTEQLNNNDKMKDTTCASLFTVKSLPEKDAT